MKDFKYPLYRMFFDADQVACTFVEDLVKEFPELQEQFMEKSWEITRLKPIEEEFIVMALADAIEIIDEYISLSEE